MARIMSAGTSLGIPARVQRFLNAFQLGAVAPISDRAENYFSGIGIGETIILVYGIDAHGDGVDQLFHAAGGTDGRLTLQAVHHRQDGCILAHQGCDVTDGSGQMVVFQGHKNQVRRFGNLVRVNHRDIVQLVVNGEGSVSQAFVPLAPCHKGDGKAHGVSEHGRVGGAHGAGTHN